MTHMARLSFTPNLTRNVPCPDADIPAPTIFAQYFTQWPAVRNYVLDGQGTLPQRHAYDLVYRHGLDVDSTGDRLAFGRTTGSL
jgi:hypothetical protein